MCNSKTKSYQSSAEIDGRRVLQPACNRILTAVDNKPRPKLRKSLSFPNPPSSPPPYTRVAAKAATKRCSVEAGSLNSSTEKPPSPKPTAAAKPPHVIKKKPKNNNQAIVSVAPILIDNTVLTTTTTATTTVAATTSLDYKYISSLLEDGSPGSLAAAHRERAAIMQERRKMRIAHYGRAASSKVERKVVPSTDVEPHAHAHEEKRCTFITPNSDPAYVAYHDEEWGVPVYDDRMLFELLVMSGAQLGSDWTTILKKRDCLRAGFCGFDPEAVSHLTEKQMALVSEDCGIDLVRVRGVVDNSKCILKIMKDFGTFAKYLWGFVNNKPLSPQYRSCRKIPAKTSKAESISKDMVSRGFRFVGPTVVHSFMQAAGLTNDHLVTCPRHSKCHHAAAAAGN